MQSSLVRNIFYLLVVTIIVLGFYFLKNSLHLEAYPDDDEYVIVDDPEGEEEIGDVEVLFSDESSDPVEIIEEVKNEKAHHSEVHSEPADSTSKEMSQEEEPETVQEEQPATEREDATRVFFDELLSSYREEVLGKIPPNKSRTDVIVRYYQHEADGKKVLNLKEYGFYIHERPVEEKSTGKISNSIYYGDEVPRRDIQLIAYVLLKNDLPLKQIVPSKFHDSWKSEAVEIGNDPRKTNAPTLTLEEVRNFSK